MRIASRPRPAARRRRILAILVVVLAASLAGGAVQAQQIDPSGTTWEAVGDFIQRYRPASSRLVRREINGRYIYDSVTVFGPTSDPPLASDEFLIVVTDGRTGFEITGTYTDDNPRKPKLTIDEAAAAASIAAFAEAQFAAVGLIQNPAGPTTVTFRSIKASAKNKVNNGLERIKTRVKAVGVVNFQSQAAFGDFRFRIKYSGKGFLVDVEIPD